MTKQYTHQTRNHKYLARIIATDLENGQYPVVVALKAINEVDENLALYSSDLKRYGEDASHLDLVEYNMWDSVAVDTKVWARNHWSGSKWYPRHFAECTAGVPYTYSDGHTSWTNLGRPLVQWADVRLASEFTPLASDITAPYD